MRKNVGTLDASIRITVGLVGLAFAVGRMSRRPYRTPWMLMFLSAMKVAEGITRFCPMLYSMGLSTRTKDGLKPLTNVFGSRMQKEMEQLLTTASQANEAAASHRNGSSPDRGSHNREAEQNRQTAEEKSEATKEHRDENVLHPTH